MQWRRKWQPTPVFLPGESQGQRSLVGCRQWGHRVGHDWSDLAVAAAVINSWHITAHMTFSISVALAVIFSLSFLIFLVLSFSKILDPLHYLNSFSGRFPIFTSFSCFSGILSSPFIWNITLCLFILINFLWCDFHSRSCGIVILLDSSLSSNGWG